VLVVAIGLATAARSWLNPPSDPMEEERPGIEAAMGQYRNAYRNRDLDGVTKVFPALSAESRQVMQRAFADCLVYEVTFADLQVTLNGSDPGRAQADVRSTHTCTPSSGGRQTETSRRDLFELRKNDGAWLIESATPAPASTGGSQ
jgi:ketosteroid isomerase-like protein